MGRSGRFGCVKEGAVLLLGATETHPDIAYVTGFRAPDPVALLMTAAGSWLVVSALEVARARRTAARGVRVVTPEDLCGGRPLARRGGRWLGLLCREAGVRRVRVPAAFPHGAAELLAREGIRVTVVRGALFPEREIKRPRELEAVARAQRAAVAGYRAAAARLRAAGINSRGELTEGRQVLTSEALRRTIDHAVLAAGALARDTIVAGGAQGADPHERGSGPLRAGEPIVMDIFPREDGEGYYGDLTRTVCRGAPSREACNRFRAVRAAQRAALAVVRAGVPAQAVHAAAADELERRGFRTGVRDGTPVGFFHSTGHGVGLSLHEGPAVAAGVETILRAGHVVTIEPGLYDPLVGGIRIEDTVVVARGGWRPLAACPVRFVLDPVQ